MGGSTVLLVTMGVVGVLSFVFSLFMVRIEIWQSMGASVASESEAGKVSC